MFDSRFIDQLSRSVTLHSPPKRIISLVPSQTELLFDLGLGDHVIGITRFCTHPAQLVKSKVKVGGTKQLNIDVIRQLKPDLILGNKEENDREQIENLMREFTVWMSDIDNLDAALAMISGIGSITNRVAKASQINHDIIAGFNTLLPANPQIRVAYLIWQKPYMVAGKNTFIDDMLRCCGCINAFSDTRYPEVTEQHLRDARPNVVMLSSEPYPFKQKHIDSYSLILPGAKVVLVDGEMFSWYGSRLVNAPAYFTRLMEEISGLL